MTNTNTKFFKFIGDYPEAKLVKSFTVAVDKEEFAAISKFPYPNKMKGEVIESKNKARQVGEKAYFVNPYYEMHISGFPSFVRVYRA